GEIASPRRLERRRVQRRLCRDLQCAAAVHRPALRLASAGLLPQMRFAKAHAYGNDFLYVRATDVEGARLELLAREMCCRHMGTGAVRLTVYGDEGGRVSMRLFNADGSRAEVSGNGVRGLGALVLSGDPQVVRDVAIQTEAGVKQLSRVHRDGTRQTFRT